MSDDTALSEQEAALSEAAYAWLESESGVEPLHEWSDDESQLVTDWEYNDPERLGRWPQSFRAGAAWQRTADEQELAALRAIGTDTVEGKRLEEAVAHAVGRDTARCALAALRAAL